MNNISIVIPVYNESENLDHLIKELVHCLKKINIKIKYEIIIVNDGSTDKTLITLKKLNDKYKFKIITNQYNQGQSYSISSGIKISKYNTIITLDGDLQNDPNDLNKLLNIYFGNGDVNLVGGIRKNRKDKIMKIFSSKFANYIRKFILKDDCVDTGCSLKIFDKEIFLKFPYFNGMHRFLPALFKGYGSSCIFTNVNHRQRVKGESNYGIFDRLLRGIIDLIRVKKILMSYNKKNV